jgi:hypothetical protein
MNTQGTQSDRTPTTRGLSRREALQRTMLGGSALAVSTLLPSSASAAVLKVTDASFQAPGVDADVDTSHATDAVARLLAGYFRVKSEANLDATMSYFSGTKLTYIDATLGLAEDNWQSMYSTFAAFMPHWPAGSASYPSRIMGDTSSAVVFYTDTAGLFGPAEIRAVGVVNFEAGKVVRWIDYWDGRHFGVANLDALAVQGSKFPTNFREDTVSEAKSSSLERVAHGLASALNDNDYVKAVSYFGPDAVLTDHPSHLAVTGKQSIGKFLPRAGRLLPFVGPGTAVRHVVGNGAGGAYEWTAKGAVPRGVNTIELDEWGHINRLDAMWNGALVDDDTLLRLARSAIES